MWSPPSVLDSAQQAIVDDSIARFRACYDAVVRERAMVESRSREQKIAGRNSGRGRRSLAVRRFLAAGGARRMEDYKILKSAGFSAVEVLEKLGYAARE